jgi:salicylate---CoA ligase
VRIACLGGGPGGLLAALLAKRGDPGREVTVFERNRAGDTFGWWRGQALGAEVAAVADGRQAATALVDGATRLSYASLRARADAVASRLTDGLGLARGDRIVVQLPNCWQFVVLTLGCLRAGIVPVMALPAHREHELAYLCEHSEARALAVPDVLRDFDHQAMFSDAPVFEKLNLLRTEITA